MFQIGDRVLYGIHGICCVTAVEKQRVDKKIVNYLVLEPEGQAGARYLVPMHSEAAMGKLRAMLTREELEALISSESVHENGWIADENRRKDAYRELITAGDREKLMKMVHTLYLHRATQHGAGRKVHMCDDNFLRDAEKLLCSEICAVMDMNADEAKRYLREKLGETDQAS